MITSWPFFKRITLFILLFHSLSAIVLAQSCAFHQNDFPDKSQYVIKQVKAKVGTDIGQLPDVHKKIISKAYEERALSLVQQIEEGDFYFEPEIDDYFQNIFTEIVRANPQLSTTYLRLLVSRYAYANAYCMGEGTIVFNLELLARMKNSSQIAFIICHEIAHQQLNHVNKALEDRTKQFHSQETKKELKRIAKSEYGTLDMALNLLQGLVFEDRRHSRLHEAEADAIAFALLKNTSFEVTEAIKCMELLDKVDEPRFSEPLVLQTIFNHPNYPFKKHWLEKEVSIFGGNDTTKDWHKDSLKTHPACTERIGFLETLLKKEVVVNKKKKTESIKAFQKLQLIADLELANNDFIVKNFGRSLYNALHLLKKYPNEPCLYTLVGKNLNLLYQAQKNHELSYYLDKPSPWQEADYKTLLDFLATLRLKEIASINYHFLAAHQEQFIANKHYHETFIQATKLAGKEQAIAALLLDWQKKYSSSPQEENLSINK